MRLFSIACQNVYRWCREIASDMSVVRSREPSVKDPCLPFSSGTPEEKGQGDEEAKKGA